MSRKNKTKQNEKNWRQTIKKITNEFQYFDVRPLHCNFGFFLQQKQQELYCAFSTLTSCLKIYNNKFSRALLFWIKHMHRNYCFWRMQHSYAACDAALTASVYINVYSTTKQLQKCFCFANVKANLFSQLGLPFLSISKNFTPG